MKKSLPWWQRLELVRQYWPLILFVLAATAFLYNLPGRIASAEKKIETVGTDVDDLKGWARELQGYTRAQQEMNQQAPNQMSRPQAPSSVPQPIPNLPVPPQTPIRVYWEQTEDGEWFCTDERESWWPNDQGDCE